MHRIALSALAAVSALGFASAAVAADMPMKAPVYRAAPAAAYNWSGFYVGGNVGYGWSSNSDPDMTFVDNSGALTAYVAAGGIAPVTVDPKGVVGGIQAGYNWQSASFVYGIVADFQASGMKDDGTFVSFNGGVTTLERKMDWFGTVRGRLGFAQQNWLFYGTGGFAYGHIKEDLSFNLGNTVGSGSSSETRAGWTVGAGIEVGFSHWSAGLEYLYIDLGRTSVTEAIAPVPLDYVTMSSRNTANIVRGLISYRF